MKFTFNFLFSFLCLCLLLSTACASTTTPSETPITETVVGDTYEELMDWLILQSNDYSGVLNPRQTWILSYDGYEVKEEYFWDGEPEITIIFDIRNIEKAKIEQRFTNSIALYPKEGKTEYFDIKRLEDGEIKDIEGEYYNWMVEPNMKEMVLERMEKVMLLVKGL